MFCITQDRYIGLVPAGTIFGDRIGVILGCDVPFILRKDQDDWKLVCECYIHRLIDGEAISMEEVLIEGIWLM